MATQGSFGGGGGGGFGGFPYRSSHQQGTDGRGTGGNNGNNNNRRRTRQRKQRSSTTGACEAEIYISMDRRGRIIGRGGIMIKQLREAATTTIHVPPVRDTNPNHPIRIKGSGIVNVLYTCWKISKLLLDNENESIPCKIIERSTNITGSTHNSLMYRTIMKLNDSGSFLIEENGHLSAYCIELINISEDDLEFIIDNQCFINTEIDATCEVITIVTDKEKEQNDTTTTVNTTSNAVAVVIYGSPSQKPEILYNALIPYSMTSTRTNRTDSEQALSVGTT